MTQPQHYELGSVLHALRTNMLVPVLTAGAFLLLGCCYLWMSTPLYEARVTIIARTQSADLPGGNIISGFGLNLLGGLGRNSQLTPYDKLIAVLGSDEVADALLQRDDLMSALFPDDWDAVARRWRQPRGIRARLSGMVNRVFGLPPSRLENAGPVTSYLDQRLQVVPNESDGSHTMLVRHADARIATNLLEAVLNSADSLLRARDKRANSENIHFLRERLATESMVEVREVLSRRLGEEYVTSSLLANQTSYSYEILRRLSVSTQPVTPKPYLTLLISVLAGTVVGAAAVVLVRGPL